MPPSQGNSSSQYRGYVYLLTLIAAFSAAVAGPWVYSDNSEPEEGTIRVTVLGSGTPDVRRHQVASSFLIEVGNGEKFIFDMGTGSYINLIATGVPAAKLNKVFLSHLHSDHHADLASLYVGAMFGRTKPWEVWGPSSEKPELGLAASIEGLRQFLAWDTFARRRVDMIGREDHGDEVITHEFDYSVEKQVIYSRNGVNVTSTPVQHYTTAGPVALRLDYAGLSVTYSGDTHPTKTLNELAKGTDVLIQQIMGPLPAFDTLSYESQYLLNTSHFTPKQAGEIFDDVKPRLAVIHHATVNEASRAPLLAAVRDEYPRGALVINEDLAVYEISKDGVRHRKRIVPERSWGLWHAEQNWNSLDDDVSANDISAPRADVAAPRGGRLIAKSGNAVA
ncbi:Metallo-hydrolase/oxidoreductase [Coccomyxa subellipsoidea C-169]|uniref:Metallo-hydrolase/oxidoreductase n=1 Tax=Coccomyxa subellipsoidea (strain C-169) TaxID=574566 RepID=I0YPR3_COCSC|nr:Metallo-hydrolase/oxidoreductase [Coccomyxa subellipsoidea C-169]EIE20382.1 Metallo-hydrolase/oxidoreductase [Coccomyxa subellipsoidea C-169]|eukprot:XP_005644926.1 Metallo-hydrolase/oxidoreductase [Coccomyxa subellipsoidea C-169]